MGSYIRPERLEDAVGHLAGRRLSVIAGCTDFLAGPGRLPAREGVLDITGIESLRGIADEGDRIRIGATTTWTDLVRAPLPRQFDALKRASRQIGGVQIQNAGTLGGNLCNASPAADGVPALLILDASVELVSSRGRRELPLGDFILGSRRTARRDDELLSAILVPKAEGRCASAFFKLGARRYQVISIVMVAALLEADGNGSCRRAAVAVGSCSEVAVRLPALEAALAGVPLAAGEALAERVDERHVTPLRPIDDVRGTALYRQDAALTLVRRTLVELAERLE